MSTQNQQDLLHSTTNKPRSLWRNRDYLLLWSGQAISNSGGAVSLIAFPLLVLYITQSPLAAGIAGTLRTLPRVLFLIAGALLDRWNRKHVMIICDIGRACSLISIPIALSLHGLTIWQLYITACLEGTLQVFFDIAQASSLSYIVPNEQLPSAMAQQEVVEGTTILLGPAIAGPLFVLGPIFPFITDAISYLISVISLGCIRQPFQTGSQPKQERHLLTEIRQGIVWAWQQPVIRTMNLSGILAALVMPSSALIVIVRAQQLHASDSLIGIIFVIGGLGAILGSFLAPLLQRFLKVGQIIITVRWLFALSWPFYMLVNHPLQLGIIEFFCCFIDPFEDVAYFSYRLAVIPNELRARVISVCRMYTSLSNPLGQLLMGFILESYGVPQAVIFGWIILVVTALLFNLQPQVRAARQPT